MTFAPEYVAYVLRENFEDAKAQFLPALMAIHYAHLVMLAERGIVSRRDAAPIRDALNSISLDRVREAAYDETCEDLYFYVERLIVAASSEDVAGRLHTARSRNDIDTTMYRMQLREMVLVLVQGTARLRHVLLDLADGNRDAIFAAHTHTQPAQPTTVAHYLLAAIEQLERDGVRLKAAYATTNRSPLGACAITGTAFPIDRARTSELLGFDRPTVNTYGSIATVDYLLESVSAAAVMLAGLGRLVQDLLLWCTTEFGYLRLADGFVQGSSIMPQKRNPVALEHARAIGSKALGQASAIMLSVHNTPFGDTVDAEDDLQPLVFSMFKDAARTVRLVAATMTDAELDRDRLAASAATGWITVTELADTLVRDHGVPFTTSHTVASRLVAEATRDPAAPKPQLLRDIAAEVTGRPIDIVAARLDEILSPRHFVEVRAQDGGPAPSATARAIAESRSLLAADEEWVRRAVGSLRAAEEKLEEAAASLQLRS
jgi:argininosuccinate lyase